MATKTCVLQENKSKTTVIEHAFNVIDSKIQYLNHQTKGIVPSLVPTSTAHEEGIGEAKSDSPLSLEEVEKLFLYVEQQSRKKKLLLHLRSLLNPENVILVLALLTDNKLYEFSEREINYILDTKSYKQAA